jgi:uncharacterized membrane protein
MSIIWTIALVAVIIGAIATPFAAVVLCFVAGRRERKVGVALIGVAVALLIIAGVGVFDTAEHGDRRAANPANADWGFGN